jgi:hypothetical protein
MAKRPGKYAHVVSQLPRFPGDDPDRKMMIDELKLIIIAPPKGDDLTGRVDLLLDEMEARMKALIAVERRASAGKPWASEYARIYAELRKVRDTIGAWDSWVGLLLEAYQELMTAQMEVEGTEAIRLSTGQPISVYLEPYSQVVDKEAHRLWAIEEGLERQMSLPWSTTNSLTKQRLLAGEPEPPGVKLFSKTKVRLGSE